MPHGNHPLSALMRVWFQNVSPIGGKFLDAPFDRIDTMRQELILKKSCSSCQIMLDPAPKARVIDDLRAAAQVELLHRIRLVRLNRFNADRQLIRDLFIRKTTRHQRHHLDLTLRQRLPLRLTSANHIPRAHTTHQLPR